MVKYQSPHDKIILYPKNKSLEFQKIICKLLEDPHNHGFNLGPRSCFLPNIDMRTFDGNSPTTLIFHMEQLFDLDQVPTSQKVTIASMYLELDRFVW